MLKIIGKWLIGLAVAIAIGGPIYAAVSSENFRNCEQHQGQYPTADNKENKLSPVLISNPNGFRVFWSCSGGYSSENGPAMTAIATVLLTIITGFLGYVAWDQGSTTRTQLRAYVYPGRSIVSKFNLPKPIVISLDVRNSGVTPAREFECHGVAFIAKLPLPDDSKMQEPAEDPVIGRHSKASIFPNEPNNIDFPCIDELTAEVLAELQKQNPEFALYFAGEARYLDIFGKNRKTRFCRFVDPADLKRLIAVQKGRDQVPEDWVPRFCTAHILNDFT